MRLIIFIGHFKTGTTTLQRFFARNFVALLRHGILYPSVESQGLSRNLAAFVKGTDNGNLSVSLNITEPHNALALRLKNEEDGHGVPIYYPNLPSGFQMLELLSNQVNALRPDTVILCAEVFSLFGLTAERRAIERLVARFSHADVTIYCNLRRPDDYLSSWHRQRLKFGAPIAPLRTDGFDQYIGSAHIEQAKVVKGWVENRFQAAQIVARSYEDVIASGGAIKDFIKHSRIDFPKDLVDVKDFNPSVPCALAEVGRRALDELPREQAQELMGWLISARKRIKYPDDSEVEMLGEANRQKLTDTFRPIQDELVELTGNDKFHDFSDLSRLRPINELEAAQAALAALQADAASSLDNCPTRKWLDGLDLNPSDRFATNKYNKSEG